MSDELLPPRKPKITYTCSDGNQVQTFKSAKYEQAKINLKYWASHKGVELFLTMPSR